MRSPVISVIMATYNHADFVAQAMRSVLDQRDVDIEFLIADDGSSDGTRDVVASIHDERIRFFPNTVNRGACIVTNELIDAARGEFIALINSDDYWVDADKLSFQLKIMRDNPELGACFGRARFVDKDGKPIAKSSLPFGTVFDQENRSQGAWLRRFFDLGNCICHPTMLIRRACYQELGTYSNRLRQLPDLDMWIRLVKRHPIHVTERELINFRILPGENASSQTAVNSVRTMNEHFLIAEHFFDDVGAVLLNDGFRDVLKQAPVNDDIDLEIEKTLLFFNDNFWLHVPYRLIGLQRMAKLLNDQSCRAALQSKYQIDDRWFQKKMGEINYLRAAEKNHFSAAADETQARSVGAVQQPQHVLKKMAQMNTRIYAAIQRSGGVRQSIRKALSILRHEGLAGIRHRL
jgi:glycosyltransferase involved in cell wall biosynthesis